MSNLEPIEEGDLNLKEKFVGGAEPKTVKETAPEKNLPDGEIKEIHSVEGNVPEKRKEGAVEKEAAYSKILSKVSSQKHIPTADTDVKSDAEEANAGIDAESKITSLVKIAETKGVAHAVKVARHMEDNYTLDEFHDRLLGEELHKALVEKGLVKEI